MIITAIAFLSLSGVMGLCMFIFSLREKNTRAIKIFAHGFVALTGLLLLFNYSFNREKDPLASTVLFSIAAVGGFIMLMRDIAGRYTPGWIAVLHGIVAGSGFALLLLNTFLQ